MCIEDIVLDTFKQKEKHRFVFAFRYLKNFGSFNCMSFINTYGKIVKIKRKYRNNVDK